VGGIALRFDAAACGVAESRGERVAMRYAGSRPAISNRTRHILFDANGAF
jgi:hypothetical protein